MSDRILWDAMRNGKKSALEAIYSREVEYLYNYAIRISRNSDLVQDCIQDLFIDLWKKRETIGSTDAIRPYLITSLRRKLIHSLKKESKTSGEAIENVDFRSDEAIESKIIQDETQTERQKALKDAMSQLSSRQREAIYHKYFNNHSYEEICQIMDINYQSVRNLISQGIKKMKGFIDDG